MATFENRLCKTPWLRDKELWGPWNKIKLVWLLEEPLTNRLCRSTERSSYMLTSDIIRKHQASDWRLGYYEQSPLRAHLSGISYVVLTYVDFLSRV